MRSAGKRWANFVLLAGWLVLGGCAYADLPRRVDGSLLTFYTMPREPHRGEARVALRVQDRDYRVLTQAQVELVVIEPDGNSRPPVALVLGGAKDYRARVEFPVGGEYRLAFKVLPAPGARRLISVYPLRVAE